MEVMLAFFETPEELGRRDDPTQAAAYWGAWSAYVEAVRAAGVMRGGNGLQPPAQGVTVRRRNGSAEVLDGPYGETREQLGGYFVLDVAEMPEAIRWAERAPCAEHGRVEVRPVLPPMPA